MPKVDQTSTVQEFISMRTSDEATYYNFSILEYLNGVEYTVSNLIDDYLDDIKSYATQYRFTELEAIKYKYRPDLLAFDIYGSEQLSFIILAINGMVDEYEFDLPTVYMIDSASLLSLLGRIRSAENIYINTNRTDMNADIKADKSRVTGR